MAEKPKFEEIDVERINIVTKDGQTRMVISNEDKYPDPVMQGHRLKRDGEKAPGGGLVFYNCDGDECGGLGFNSTNKDGHYEASAGLMFDQHLHDQVVCLTYDDENGKRDYGVNIYQRPNIPSFEPGGYFGNHHRMFFGRTSDGESMVLLKDSQGRPRIRLYVDSDDMPRFEMLDENGEIMYCLPPK